MERKSPLRTVLVRRSTCSGRAGNAPTCQFRSSLSRTAGLAGSPTVLSGSYAPDAAGNALVSGAHTESDAVLSALNHRSIRSSNLRRERQR